MDQELMVRGSRICELDSESIPTGKTLDVLEHRPFDFRETKPIGRDIDKGHIQLKLAKGYDHPWILDKDREAEIWLHDPHSGRYLEISTDQDVVVIYTMNYGCPLKLTNGMEDSKFYGIAFETQGYPIGHNEAFKEKSVIRANEIYTQTTTWTFGVK